MPDLKAVPFDPKKKVWVKMPVSCRCRAERRKQEEQIPDGVQMTVNAAMTTFAAVDGKPAGIESMGTAECNMLASYTRGTVSFSVHGEKPVMVSVRLDELMRLLQAAAVCHHEPEDKKNAEEEKV